VVGSRFGANRNGKEIRQPSNAVEKPVSTGSSPTGLLLLALACSAHFA
jgi:hypothetical protein